MRDRQTLFYRTLPGQARDPTSSLQQVTGAQSENNQTKGDKLRANIRSWKAKNVPELSSKYLKEQNEKSNNIRIIY